MRHLITGGSGFVGSNIANMLSARGEEVVVVDLWENDELHNDVQFIKCDIINEKDKLSEAMKGIDYVHHNAALVPLSKSGSKYTDVNVVGTKNTLEAAQKCKVKMFAHMSSSAVFGSPDEIPITNYTLKKPVEIYGKSKLEGENLVLNASHDGLPVTIIRPRTVIGIGRLGIFQILFDWIKDGASIFVIGSGNVLFQFIHVDDLSEVSIQSCLRNKPGIYNVGTDRFGTLKEDLTYLCNHAKTGSKVRGLPITLAIKSLEFLDKVGLSPLSPWHYLTYHKPFVFDSKPVYERLNWRPKYSNKDMLVNSYDWFIENYNTLKIKDNYSAHKKPVRQGILNLLKHVAKFL